MQKDVEIVRKEWFRQVMFVARGMALLAIRASSEAAHRDSKWSGLHLAEQLPSIAVWKPKIADQDIEVG